MALMCVSEGIKEIKKLLFRAFQFDVMQQTIILLEMVRLCSHILITFLS